MYLPNLQTRFLRLEFNAPLAGAALQPQSFEFSRSIEAFCYNIARNEQRGWYPRWLHREQTLWTPIGTAHGTHCALMNEEGVVEPAPASFSIEPMVAMGRPETRVLGDGWTAVTRDGGLAAHFEHTVAATSAGPLVLTARKDAPAGVAAP